MPYTSTAEEKAALRAHIRAAAKRMSEAARRESDAALFVRLLSLPVWAVPGTVLLYRGMGTEPDTGRLIAPLSALGWRVALPRCLPDRAMEARLVDADTPLTRHPYGMLEPGIACPTVVRPQINLILVPGLAFDQNGYRLGQGGGYYDRYLSSYAGYTIALCRDAFLLPALPTQPHDCPVDLLVTETRLLPPS